MAKRKADPNTDRETIAAPYTFTDAEQIDLGKQLAALQRQIVEIEAQKKAANYQFKSRLSSVESQAAEVGRKVSDGKELRPTDCIVIYDAPKKEKSYYRVDNGEFVETRPMTSIDFERNLPLGEDE